MLAHSLADWAAANPEHEAAPEAARDHDSHDDGHVDAARRLAEGHNVHQTAGCREFEVCVCRERDCLKYCPTADCRTVTSVTDTDPWCWVCGAHYVPPDHCAWLG